MQLQEHSTTAPGHDRDLYHVYQRLSLLYSHVTCVRDEIEEAQRALQDENLHRVLSASEQNVARDCEIWAWLKPEVVDIVVRHETPLLRKGNNSSQLQLGGSNTQQRAEIQRDIECGNWEHTCQDMQYHGAVRFLPLILVVVFLTALGVFFGFDLLHHQTGLTMTQKVASIGSATLTVIAVVAMIVRAAMCTTEWQWGLHMCYRMTGWLLFQPTLQQPQGEQPQKCMQGQDAAKHLTNDSFNCLSHVQPTASRSDPASVDNDHEDDEASTECSFDIADLEAVKKQS